MEVLAGRKSAPQVHMLACERYSSQLSMLLEFKVKVFLRGGGAGQKNGP